MAGSLVLTIFVISVLLILTFLYQISYNGMTKCKTSKRFNKYDDFKFESGGEGSWQMVIWREKPYPLFYH